MLTLGVRQGQDEAVALGMGVESLSKRRKHRRIDPIGLRQITHRLGVVTRLARVYHGDLITRGLKRTRELGLISARRLHHDQANIEVTQAKQQPLLAGGGVLVGGGGGGGGGVIAGEAPGLAYEQQVAQARGLVSQDPKRVAQVVKTWVSTDG